VETVWFCLVALTIALYVVFDGFDLGAGVLHLVVTRSDAERRLVLRSIGPVWDGNEVWLIAAGATIFCAFPTLYAVSFSGFYLPLMIVLWLLILRGVAIEFRGHIDSPAWTPLWDVVFSLASLALAFVFGAALGNVIRGVPLDARGRFFEPLWTDMRIGPETGILDWYTIAVGVTSVCALTLHGALWIVLKADGDLQRRARAAARASGIALGVAAAATSLLTFIVQPQVAANLSAHPWGVFFPALAVGGWSAALWLLARGGEMPAFLDSCVCLVGMVSSAAFGIHPFVLPAVTGPDRALTVSNAAAGPYGLSVGLIWWIPGMLLVAAYFVQAYRHSSGKATLEGEGY